MDLFCIPTPNAYNYASSSKDATGAAMRIRPFHFILIAFLSFVPALAAVRNETVILAKELSAQYLAKNPAQAFQKNLAVLDLTELSPALKKNRIGSVLSALLISKFSESTVFHVVERGDGFKKIMKEQSLAQSGLVDEATAVKAGELLGAELLLDGTVSELGEDIVVTARLVSVEKGEVLASKTINLKRTEVLREADAFMTASFQSENGINVGAEWGLLLNLSAIARSGQHAALDVGYRVNRYLNVGAGFLVLGSVDYQQEKINTTNIFKSYLAGPPDFSSNVTRNYSFLAFGPKLFVDVTIPVATRFNFGVRGAFGLLPGAHIFQTLTRFPVPTLLNGGGSNAGFTSGVVPVDFTVDATSDSPPIYVSGELLGDFLLTKRASIGFRVGYIAVTSFNPNQFEALGIQQKSSYASGRADNNGGFANLFGFNFNRNASNKEIEYSFSGLMLSLAISVHI